MRSRNVDIAYVHPRTLKDTVESVHGFTAVIFQHECDHLDGVLYIDEMDRQLTEEETEGHMPEDDEQ